MAPFHVAGDLFVSAHLWAANAGQYFGYPYPECKAKLETVWLIEYIYI